MLAVLTFVLIGVALGFAAARRDLRAGSYPFGRGLLLLAVYAVAGLLVVTPLLLRDLRQLAGD